MKKRCYNCKNYSPDTVNAGNCECHWKEVNDNQSCSDHEPLIKEDKSYGASFGMGN